MGKFILFYILWRITGNPFLALLLLLVVFYILDRRYVGIFPSVTKPFQISRRIARLQAELELNPYHTGNKHELARIWIEQHKYPLALPYMQEIIEKDQTPEVQYELGLCLLKTGKVEQGEELILLALKENPMLKYGEPYLQLVEVFSKSEPEKALHYIEQIRGIHSSSVEIYYRLGKLLLILERKQEAKAAFQEARMIYRSLPNYMRRKQRKWAVLSRLRVLS